MYVDLQSRRLWVALAAGSLVVTRLLVVDGPYQSVWSAVQYDTFQFMSAMTCARFATALNLGAWPSEALFVMTLGIFVGVNGNRHQGDSGGDVDVGIVVSDDERVLSGW